jgi:AAA family ATP:ADP antiporter
VISIIETGSRKKLILAIKDAMDDTLKRVFNILALHFNSRDVFIAYRGLQSKKKETRAATMEFLEGLISRNYKSQLFPIIEAGISHQGSDITDIHDRVALPSEKQCYYQLLQLEDRKINKLVIKVIADSNNPELVLLLVGATTKKDPKVAEAASEAYLKVQNISKTA